MLEEVAGLLRCPLGEPALRFDDGALTCAVGHRFDVARQGYVNLLQGAAPAGVDTAEMVSARARLLAAGHQAPLTDALATALDTAMDRRLVAPIVDLGAGTGYHLAGLLGATSAPAGLAVDLSKHAARRAARAHSKVGAVVADVWSPLPIRTGVADVVMNVFAPRNVDESARILTRDGRFVVVTPSAEHLAPLVERLGLLRVAPGKTDDLDAQVAQRFTLVHRAGRRWSSRLDHDAVGTLVAMGPSAWHTDAAGLQERIAELPDPVEVTFAVDVSVLRLR